MKFSEVCIKRPVFSLVLTLILIVLGIVTGLRLPIQQNPTINKPVITVEVQFRGASPHVIESQITSVLEDEFSKISGVDYMKSKSSDGQSSVTMFFLTEKSIVEAAADVRDSLSRVQGSLPDGITNPVIKKRDSNDKAVVILSLTSDTFSLESLYDYAERYIKPNFEVIPGNAGVEVSGSGLLRMLIRIDPYKLAAYGLTFVDIKESVVNQSVEMPGGSIYGRDRTYSLTTLGHLDSAPKFEEIVVGYYENKPIKLKDVGYVEIAAENRKDEVRFGKKDSITGKPSSSKQAVSISIMKQSTANPLNVAAEVLKIFPSLVSRLPNGVKLEIADDKTVFIAKSLNQVYQTLVEAILLVILVVFLFLWSLRASFIPLVAIPVSLIGALFLMYLADCSINTLTLLAMVLAIGLVVDDAIVILENIYIKIEQGMNPFKASIEGTKEIAFAVIAMTLTLTAVYAPIGLAKGATGKLFKEFALALSGAVMLSGFVALTLSPMMCSLILKPIADVHAHHNSLHARCLNALDSFYEKILQFAVKIRILMILLAFGISGGGYYLAKYCLPVESSPKEDHSAISVGFEVPRGVTTEFLRRYVKQLDDIMKEVPEVDGRFTAIQLPEVDAWLTLDPWEKRKRTSKQIADSIRSKLDDIGGVVVRLYPTSSALSSSSGDVISFAVLTPKSYDYLTDVAHEVIQQFLACPGIKNVMSETVPQTKDFAFEINRDFAQEVNIDVSKIADVINIFGGRKANHFYMEGKQYDVVIEAEDRFRNPEVFSHIFVRGSNTESRDKPTLVSLDNLVTLKQKSAPVEITRYQKMRSIGVEGSISQGHTLWEIIDYVRRIEKGLPNDVKIEFTGDTREFLNESQAVHTIFLLALIFIFLVLAAQFESFIDPIIIMVSVPISLTGALATLALVPDGSLNVFSQIGLVTLIGLITKHGILIVEFANQLREGGMEKIKAVVQASKQRLRPILMTTFAMVLGALPLALATGAGAESRRQIGWVVVGGMTFGTLFTLLVVPVVYIYVSRKKFNKPQDDQPQIQALD